MAPKQSPNRKSPRRRSARTPAQPFRIQYALDIENLAPEGRALVGDAAATGASKVSDSALDYAPDAVSGSVVEHEQDDDFGPDEPGDEPEDADDLADDLTDELDDDELGDGPRYEDAEGRSARTVHEGTSRFAAGTNGKDEMNLAEFPIARLGRNDTRMTIEYKGQITDKLGNVIEQRWLVSGNATFGLPTEFADRVLVALMYITGKEVLKGDDSKREPGRRVPFTIYRILKLLGLSRNQRNYAAVEKALQQLVGVTIYSEDAFWDHQLQRRVTTKKGFHILEDFWLKSFEEDDPNDFDPHEAEGKGTANGRGKRRTPITGYVVWGERIWDSFQAGYIKNLDVEFYYALENTLARRLYRFLDKRMHYQNSYQIDIFDLAARMGMKPYPFASHLARKLKPAFDELIEQGFLARADVIKVGDYTRMRFVRAQPKTALEINSTDAGNEAPQPAQSAEQDLVARTSSTMPRQMATEGPEDAFAPVQAQFGMEHDSEQSEAVFEPSLLCRQLWAELLSDYQRTLPTATFAMLAKSELVSLDNNRAIIVVDPRYQEWLMRQMARQIKTYLNQHLDFVQRIHELEIVSR